MSYLDEPDHIWKIDPAAENGSLEELFNHLVYYGDEAAIRLVLQGYRGLVARFPEATDEQCFGTAMIWYFG